MLSFLIMKYIPDCEKCTLLKCNMYLILFTNTLNHNIDVFGGLIIFNIFVIKKVVISLRYMWHFRFTYIKVKWSRYRPRVAQRVGRGIAVLFHDRSTRRGWVVSCTPEAHFTPAKTRYPFYRRLGGPQDRSGWVENLVPTGIRSRTIQPIVSHYTDWASWLTGLLT